MGWTSDAVATIVAALVGGGIATVSSIWATNKTLNSDERLQAKLERADDLRSQEEREHEQRREAYAAIATYALRTSYANSARIAVANRRYAAVKAAFQDNLKKNVASETAELSQKDAFEGAGPTLWEQEELDADPTMNQMLDTLGLARVFATKEVLSEFRKVMECSRNVRTLCSRLDEVLSGYPTRPHEKSARQELDDPDFDLAGYASRLLNAVDDENKLIAGIHEASQQYFKAGPGVLKLIDSELDKYRGKPEPSTEGD